MIMEVWTSNVYLPPIGIFKAPLEFPRQRKLEPFLEKVTITNAGD